MDKREYQEIFCEQKQPFWHAIRKCFVTASNFGTVLGLNKYKSPEALVREFNMDRAEQAKAESAMKNSFAINWGNDHEKNGIEEYRQTLPEGTPMTFPGIVVDLTEMKLAASPDGLVGSDGIVEVKCPVNKCFYSEIPPHYVAQCVGLMGVCRRKWCDLVQWTPDGISVKRFTHCEEEWQHMKEVLEDFYAVHERHFAARHEYLEDNFSGELQKLCI